MNSPNQLIIGQAEEIDLFRPDIRAMVDKEGVYICGDTERPEYTIPVVSLGGRLYAIELAQELPPERFKDTVTVAGPFYKKGDTPADPLPTEGAVSLLRECRNFYVRMFGFPADTAMTSHSPGAKTLIGQIDSYLTSTPAETGAVVPAGWVMVPDASNMTDAQAEAIAKMANCCGGIAYDIYRVAIASAPTAVEGRS